MIRSMTGYGRAEGRHKGTPITVEVRSVNHRHSEVMVKLPRALQAHEDRIRDLVQARVARGRVDVTVSFSGERDPGRGIVLDRALVRRYHALLKELQRELGLKGSPDATLLASFRDVIRPAELAAEEPGAVRAVERVLGLALKALDQMRRHEAARWSGTFWRDYRRWKGACARSVNGSQPSWTSAPRACKNGSNGSWRARGLAGTAWIRTAWH